MHFWGGGIIPPFSPQPTSSLLTPLRSSSNLPLATMLHLWVCIQLLSLAMAQTNPLLNLETKVQIYKERETQFG